MLEFLAQLFWMLACLISVVGGIVAVTIYVYRRCRNYDLLRSFVYDIGKNHFPHIYWRLHRIDRALNQDDVESPPMRFIEPKDIP